ncbi:MAG: YlmH/Sll1252 family protein [Clostridiales bacterium]|nr:YlmH/Sll1252 family protein [Clostridiales bacterium]
MQEDGQLLLKRLDDCIDQYERRCCGQYLGFLNEGERALLEKALKTYGFTDFTFWGGFENAERTFLCIGCREDWERNAPVDALRLAWRRQDSLSHRDILGALMGLGLRREAIGDIVVEQGGAIVLVDAKVSGYVLEQMERAGRVGIHIGRTQLPQEYQAPRKLVEITGTVASCRLDCIVGLAAGVPREQAKALIAQGKVSHNFLICESPGQTVETGDKFSVRGHGKYILGARGAETKKKRHHITIQKYA